MANLSEGQENILDQVYLASPCEARWEDMAGDDKVRHCTLCSLNVYNIEAMTTREAQEFFADGKDGRRICARFYRRQDGTIITSDCPRGLKAIRDGYQKVYRRVAAFLTLFLGLGGSAIAQNQRREMPVKPGKIMMVQPWNATESSTAAERALQEKLASQMEKEKTIFSKERVNLLLQLAQVYRQEKAAAKEEGRQCHFKGYAQICFNSALSIAQNLKDPALTKQVESKMKEANAADERSAGKTGD